MVCITLDSLFINFSVLQAKYLQVINQVKGILSQFLTIFLIILSVVNQDKIILKFSYINHINDSDFQYLWRTLS
jgi:hypothetical protein